MIEKSLFLSKQEKSSLFPCLQQML